MAQRRLLTTAVPAAILVAAWTLPGQAVGQAYDVAQLEQRIVELEKKVKQLEHGPSRLRVPVEFVDESSSVVAELSEFEGGGALILNGSEGESTLYLVGDRGILFDRGSASVALGVDDDERGSLVIKSDEQTVAVLTSSPENERTGYLKLNGPGGLVEAVGGEGVGVSIGNSSVGIGIRHFDVEAGEGSDLMGVFVESGGEPVAALSAAAVGGGFVAAYNESGEIGAIMSGTGQIHVANEDGQTLATMVADGDSGSFQVRNAGGATVASLHKGLEGGYLQLANDAGNAVVEGGVDGGVRGFVRAYPVGMPGGMGMPGTFIMGWGDK